MVADQAVAQGVFETGEQRPHERRVRAVTHFGLGEDRVFGGDGDVGVEGQPTAAAHGPAAHRADHRFGHFEDAHQVHVVVGPVVHQIGGAHAGLNTVGPFDIAAPAAAGRLIEAGTKGASGAGDDDGADLRIGLGLVQGVVKLFEHRPGDGVERFGPIQCNQHAAAFLLVNDFFVVRHSVSLWGIGVLEWWSTGVLGVRNPSLQHSNDSTLQSFCHRYSFSYRFLKKPPVSSSRTRLSSRKNLASAPLALGSSRALSQQKDDVSKKTG